MTVGGDDSGGDGEQQCFGCEDGYEYDWCSSEGFCDGFCDKPEVEDLDSPGLLPPGCDPFTAFDSEECDLDDARKRDLGHFMTMTLVKEQTGNLPLRRRQALEGAGLEADQSGGRQLLQTETVESISDPGCGGLVIGNWKIAEHVIFDS